MNYSENLDRIKSVIPGMLIALASNNLIYFNNSGSHLSGRLGGSNSVPFIRFSRLSDENYTIKHEFVSKTSSRLTDYPVYPSPD